MRSLELGRVSRSSISSSVSHVHSSEREGIVRCVREDDAECEVESPEVDREAEKEADAAADVKEESAEGSVVSGAIVESIVSQLSSGLKLRARSPRPSTGEAGLQDSRKLLVGSGAARGALAGGSIERLLMRRSGGKSPAMAVSGPVKVVPVGRTAPGGDEDLSTPCLRWV
jgi:hypothetical protein